MVIGARPIGSRGIGDNTGQSLPGFQAQSGSVVFATSASLVAAARTGQRGAAVLPASASLLPTGVQKFNARTKFITDSFAIFNVPIVRVVDPSVGREPYRLEVKDYAGNRKGELENARITSASWVLNGIGGLDFTVPTKDAKALMPKVPTREVRLWRGRQLLWEGPVVRKGTDKDRASFSAQSLEWYFTKRHIGKPNRTNHVYNPSFELGAGLDGWDITSGNPIAQPAQIFPRDVSVVKSPVVDGTRALKMTMAQDDPAVVAGQTFTFTVDVNNPDGDLWTVVAWFYIETWAGPAFNYRGLTVQRASTTETVPVFTPETGTTINYPKVTGFAQVTIDEDTPRNKWVRAEVPLVQPPLAGVPEFVSIGLAGIKGTIYWDMVSLTRDESLFFNNVDQALIVKGLVEHAQDPAFQKNSLNIGTSTPLTGVKRTREYAHHDHQMINDALAEFPTLANGLDMAVEITPTSRTLTTYFPYKGYRRNDIILEYGKNIVTYTVTEDGERTANSVVVLGDGEGSDREEGGYIDTAALDGLVLEKVYNSTPGAPIQTLNDQARRGVERYKKTVIVPSITTNDPNLIGVLKTGDVCRVKVKHGAIDIDDWYRIIQITLDPNTDRLTLDINSLTEEVLSL